MKSLIIVFVKNPKLGRVKSRLANSIGEQSALKLYLEFLNITASTLKNCPQDIVIYFSEDIDSDLLNNYRQRVQKGADLGEKMFHAFAEGFAEGYEKIVLIGSDIPDLKPEHIQAAFQKLEDHKAVFGPAEDGGYYLIGLSQPIKFPFEIQEWSTSTVLNNTLDNLKNNNIDYALIEMLNDIDTFEDLLNSKVLKTNNIVIREIKKYYDTRD